MTENTSPIFEESFDEDSETIGNYHRMAAHHFSACAKHHMAAALADDEGHDEAAAHHAHLAYRHQLNGVQYAEIAVLESEGMDEEFDLPAEIEAL
ncbi:MAG: hypothetical protein NTU86_16795 [Burkholderiales bacterium]|nr:hypothetical protein [Burkholderiales bacterium]